MGDTRNVSLAARNSGFVSDSNWWLCYIVLALIPVIFFCVACFSVWRDRRNRTKFDIEAINATYSKYWSASSGARDPAETRRPAGFPQTKVGQYVSSLGRDRAGPKTQNGFPAPASTPNASYNNNKAGAAAAAAAPAEKRSQMAQIPMMNLAPAAAGPSSYAASGIVISDQRSNQRQQRAAEKGGDGGYWGNGGFKDVLI